MLHKIGLWTRKNALCILAFYFAISFVFSDFGISAVAGAGVLCALAAFGLIDFLRSGDFRRKAWDRVDILLALLLLFIVANIIRFGTISRETAYYLIITAVSFCFIWMTLTVDYSRIRAAKLIFIAAACLAALLNIIHLFFPELIKEVVLPLISGTSRAYYERISGEGYGFALGENIGYTECLMVMGAAVTSLSLDKRNAKLLLPAFFVFILGMGILQRRGELLICTEALILVTALRMIRLRKAIGSEDSFTFWELAAVTVLQVLLVVLAFSVVNRLIENSRLEHFFESVSGSPDGLDVEEMGNGRLILWQLAWDGFLEKPVFGHGWGSFALVAPLSGNIHAHNVHCVYLQLLYETGVVGFIIAGSIFMIFLSIAVRQVFRMKKRGDMLNMLLGLFVILYALGEGIMDNSLYYPYIILAFSAVLIIMFRTGKYEGHTVFQLSSK